MGFESDFLLFQNKTRPTKLPALFLLLPKGGLEAAAPHAMGFESDFLLLQELRLAELPILILFFAEGGT